MVWLPGNSVGKVLVCVFLGGGIFLVMILSAKACSLLYHFARFTFPEGVFFPVMFSCHILQFFVLGLGAKSTVIELQQAMMKILDLLPLSVMENST